MKVFLIHMPCQAKHIKCFIAIFKDKVCCFKFLNLSRCTITYLCNFCFRNIVSTVNLNCKLDLKKIALHARNAEYNPKRFAAVIMRIREPRTTALIFSSGKMVCTGAKSEEDSRLAARKYARIIQKLGFTVSLLIKITTEIKLKSCCKTLNDMYFF